MIPLPLIKKPWKNTVSLFFFQIRTPKTVFPLSEKVF